MIFNFRLLNFQCQKWIIHYERYRMWLSKIKPWKVSFFIDRTINTFSYLCLTLDNNGNHCIANMHFSLEIFVPNYDKHGLIYWLMRRLKMFSIFLYLVIFLLYTPLCCWQHGYSWILFLPIFTFVSIERVILLCRLSYLKIQNFQEQRILIFLQWH